MFTQAQRVARRPPKGRDISFRAFLARQRLPRLTRTLGTMMVQGFDAADPRQASAREIVDEWSELSSSQPRPYGGYGPLLEVLARGLQVQLETVVRRVRWSRGSVEVEGTFRGEPWRAWAPRAVITLPIGVLPSASNTRKERLIGRARLRPGDPRCHGVPLRVLGEGPSRGRVLPFAAGAVSDVLDAAADARAAADGVGRRTESSAA